MPAESFNKSRDKKPGKELYRQLRALSVEQLWEIEVPRFDRATPQERIERVSVIRALSAALAESGTKAQRDAARPWLRRLLHDPEEKIRRYATAALPKLGAGPGEEAELLSLLRSSTTDRERQAVGATLAKIGGTATLEELQDIGGEFLPQTELKVRARIARNQSPSEVNLDAILSDLAGLRIHLRGRHGLERIVASEVEDYIRARGQFRINEVRSGLVALTALAPFSLAELYELRCFDTVGLVLGTVSSASQAEAIQAMAATIAAPRSLRILQTLTLGAIRYRLDFVAKGHQRAAVQVLANRAYELCPAILNDPSNAPWTIAIHPSERGESVELVPRFTPDPRLYYRMGDVPAASHPPLAACMARLAGPMDREVVWDPFCGSSLELVERALLGGVERVIGTDLSPEALDISQRNFAAANLSSVTAQFMHGDFRDFARMPGLGLNSVSLVITNPPMGRRVPIPNLHGLIEDLRNVAADALRPGGRLVFPNPVRLGPPPRDLYLESWQMVDLGGFDCRLELYRKLA